MDEDGRTTTGIVMVCICLHSGPSGAKFSRDLPMKNGAVGFVCSTTKSRLTNTACCDGMGWQDDTGCFAGDGGWDCFFFCIS